MSRTFDYQSADVSAIAARLATVQKQSYTKLTKYYKNDKAMLAKLAQARELSNIIRAQAQYAATYGVSDGL